MKKKLEDSLSDVRKTAVAVEQALQGEERRKRAEAEKPKFISNSDIEERLNSDSTLVRAALFLRDYETAKSYGSGVRLLTKEQLNKLLESFESDEDKNTMREAVELYNGGMEYGKYIIALRAQWQKGVAELATLLTKWSLADDIAKGMTEALRKIEKQVQPLLNDKEEWVSTDGSGETFRKDVWYNSFVKVLKSNFESALEDSPYKIHFNYNPDKGEFEADIDTGGLYEAILKKRESAVYMLQALRSAVEPFSDFLYTEIEFANGERNLPVWFIPEVIERIMEYPDEADFMKDKNNLKYFSFYLKRRKENGEDITPDDEKRAVIPDYNQETDIPKHTQIAKAKLNDIFADYIPTE